METTNKYNGVTVVKSWSLLAFAKEFGTPKFAKCVNKDGENFNCLAFEKEGKLTFCHFGYSTAGMTPADIIANKNSLNVGLNSNDKYTLYKQSENAWESLDGIFD